MIVTRRLAASTCGVAFAALALLPSASPAPTGLGLAVEANAAQFAESDLWLAPQGGPAAPSDLARGATLLATERASEALPLFVRQVSDPTLGGYARLYAGRAQFALDRSRDAMDSARAVLAESPGGALGEAALWLLADAAEDLQQWPDARNALRALTDIRPARPALAWLRLARVAEKLDDASEARAAFARVYYEFPLTDEAATAAGSLSRLPAAEGPERFGLERGRAEALFAARRYADARKAFVDLRAQAKADDRIFLDLRVAECDFSLERFAAARDQLTALIEKAGPHRTEAEFYFLGVLRGLKRPDYPARVTAFVAAYPGHALAETAMNDLATAYILASDDESAASVFTDMYARFPKGTFADRAAWKAGWWAYKKGNYRETIRLFEVASVNQRRADYRPSWLYWSARAHEQLGEPEAARTWYRQTVTDYRNSYYGRLATAAIARLGSDRALGGAPVVQVGVARPAPLALVPGPRPANAPLIQRLLSAGLYDDAIAELRRVQRESGLTPLIEASIAYALSRKGDLRPGIQAMRRAYPQFMADGGELLPRAILTTIFPVEHWDLLQRYAAERNLDFPLLLAQVAQESTFQAGVRSVANAYGLMQILPSTGRRYAPKVGIRPFSTARLTDPEVNVKIGTAYFVDLLDMFGGDAAPALAAYNAGEGRVARWRAERPGVARDEFIDDIPFPETQNYVKRILGTAEDYRILYGDPVRLVRQSAP